MSSPIGSSLAGSSPPIARVVGRGYSDAGPRREHNEDAYLADPSLGLYAVSDGMGGHEGGEVASAMVLNGLRAAVARAPALEGLEDPSVTRRGEVLRWLGGLVSELNAEVFAAAKADRALWGMGCTLDVALVRGGGVYLAHVGDSRMYAARDGKLLRLTEDHTYGQDLLSEGATPEQVARHPQRAALTRAIGRGPKVQVDTAFLELQEGDRLLLCSDGLYAALDEEQLKAELARPDAAEGLVRAALAGTPDDNLTAVVITVEALQNLRPALIGAEATLSALGRSRLFAGLSPGELLRLQRVAVGRHAEPGEVIVPQEESVDGLFVVLAGSVTADRDGEPVATLGPGDPFGEHALVEGVSDVRVTASSPSDLLCFPTAALQTLLAADAHIASRVALNALRRALERPEAR